MFARQNSPRRWRIFPIALLAAMALGLLAACSGTAPSDAAATRDHAPVASEAASSAASTPMQGARLAPNAAQTARPGPGQGPGMGGQHGPGHGPGMGGQHGPGQGPGMSGQHGPGHGPGMGGQHGPENPWRFFHQQAIPEAYADVRNPLADDPESIARGETLYQTQCAACHGTTGLGDGPTAANLTPPPAPLAMTARHMPDAYLYWRITEGGAAWGTGMPAYGNVLSEEEIWDVINYLRHLASQTDGTVMHTYRLQQAIAQGLLTQEEADLFMRVHDLVEAYRTAHWDTLRSQAGGDPEAMLTLILQALQDEGQITAEEAATFLQLHQRIEQMQPGTP